MSLPAGAVTYNVDLNDIPKQAIGLSGPCYCGSGPLFAFTPLPHGATAGDFLDFGSVRIFSQFTAKSFIGYYYPFFPY
jgi:hypothetical protein